MIKLNLSQDRYFGNLKPCLYANSLVNEVFLTDKWPYDELTIALQDAADGAESRI
jgi:hypothetical protein